MGRVKGNQQRIMKHPKVRSNEGVIMPPKSERAGKEAAAGTGECCSYRCRRKLHFRSCDLVKVQSYWPIYGYVGRQFNNLNLPLPSILTDWCFPQTGPNQEPDGRGTLLYLQVSGTQGTEQYGERVEWIRRDKWRITNILGILQGLPPPFQIVSLLNTCWLFSFYQTLICLPAFVRIKA